LSVPVELGGGPIGTLDIYATTPREWDATEVSALQAYAGVVASLLGAAVRAELKGALAEQLQVALDSRVWSSGPRALMEREAWMSRRPSPTCGGRPGRRDGS
jgi:GAF domain-containing protein